MEGVSGVLETTLWCLLGRPFDNVHEGRGFGTQTLTEPPELGFGHAVANGSGEQCRGGVGCGG